MIYYGSGSGYKLIWHFLVHTTVLQSRIQRHKVRNNILIHFFFHCGGIQIWNKYLPDPEKSSGSDWIHNTALFQNVGLDSIEERRDGCGQLTGFYFGNKNISLFSHLTGVGQLQLLLLLPLHCVFSLAVWNPCGVSKYIPVPPPHTQKKKKSD